MDEQTKKLFDIINHPDFVEPPEFSEKTIKNREKLIEIYKSAESVWEKNERTT